MCRDLRLSFGEYKYQNVEGFFHTIRVSIYLAVTPYQLVTGIVIFTKINDSRFKSDMNLVSTSLTTPSRSRPETMQKQYADASTRAKQLSKKTEVGGVTISGLTNTFLHRAPNRNVN